MVIDGMISFCTEFIQYLFQIGLFKFDRNPRWNKGIKGGIT